MNWRPLWLCLCPLLLAGCASAPRFHAVCVSEVPAAALLSIAQADGHTQRLLLHAEQQAAGQVWVALDTLGSPQFSARQRGDQLTVDTSVVYRGADPLTLLWGYQWWLLARDDSEAATDDTARCAAATDYNFNRSGDAITVGKVDRPQWRWQPSEPARFELPREQLRITVEVLQ